ncbi:Peroxisome assembly protein 12 [Geodia barretti]|uniref:Peroxisome assembly protein 12 n=1 Tax=Geodia barretti TaxID=519541 RepID=A0AA35RDI0_GEOBA|nr:Peroxisome assembly protein 12 [Geodia barretti]
MAFNEAILTDERPNVFELLAEEQLREALRPALLYLTKVLARSRPELFFSGLWRSRDEVHLMLDSALQWIFLTLNDSSFSEHFYGIKRVQWGAGAGLSTKQMTVSFVCLVLVPYLKVKVERLHSVLTDENETLGMWAWQDCRTPTQLLKLLLFKSIPYLQSLWTLCHLVFRLNYLIRSSPHYSPLHWLAGLSIFPLFASRTLWISCRSEVGTLSSN